MTGNLRFDGAGDDRAAPCQRLMHWDIPFRRRATFTLSWKRLGALKPQQLIVKIGTPIPMEIVQLIPDRGGARLNEIDIAVQNGIFVRTRDAADWPSIGAGDERIAHEPRTAFGAD